jgi:hypothetical protein
LIAANSWFGVRLLLSRCDGPRSPSPPLPAIDAMRCPSVWSCPVGLGRRRDPRRCRRP